MAVRDNFSKFHHLREKYPHFRFASYGYDINDNYLNINLRYDVPGGFEFQPTLRFPWNKNIFRPFDELSEEVLENLVFHIGMIEMISYWKASCSPWVSIPPDKLSKDQTDFWKKLYFNGLGEFFYTNGIRTDIHSFMQLEGISESAPPPAALRLTGPPIVPVGGGKDSAVTLGLLNDHGIEYIPFAIHPIRATQEVILAAGKSLERTLLVERQIDPALLRLNAQGFLNGHTPFSAVVAFYGLLAAYLAGSRDIILSNESSANEATIPGTNINHQYSKTFEFERDFRKYCQDFISPDLNYFSLLRPLTEIQIARLFTRFPEFHPLFRSCNAGSKSGEWCGKCPKCLFTRIILSPFLTQEQLKTIFGHDMLEDAEMKPVLEELCGISPNKPFECIGTIDEVNESLAYLDRHWKGEQKPFLLRHYASTTLPGRYSDNTFRRRLDMWNHEHAVPESFISLFR